MTLQLRAIAGIPEVKAGDDLAQLIATAAHNVADHSLVDGDIVVVAQKVVSKAEGRAVALSSVEVSEAAASLARDTVKDPRLVQLILDESSELLRSRPGVMIVVTRQGFICANAGIDQSNVPDMETALLLPEDSDASAALLRSRLLELTGARTAVIISDSFGRAWRVGQQDVAIGCAGILPVSDLRGGVDRDGRELTASITAIADEIASAADLARAKSSGEPVVVLRGRADLVTAEDGPGALVLLRAREEDLFR